MSGEELRDETEDDVVRFVRAVEDARERQILERFGTAHPMALYCWVDKQAGEFRTSMVSASHGRLRFGTPSEIVGDLTEIAREYLACPHRDGIPMEEFTTQTREELDAYVEPEPQAVRVWASALSRAKRP